jgi:D-serine deaminase-like pyridoxal phosphate-dependent protein
MVALTQPSHTVLAELVTPALLLDSAVLERNCEAMAQRAARHGVALRPHLKTSKSAEVARLATRGHSGAITVSTVAEADYFARHGFDGPDLRRGHRAGKIEALHGIQRTSGARITLLADRVDAVRAAAARARALGARFRLLVEIDTGGGRGGVAPERRCAAGLARRGAAQRILCRWPACSRMRATATTPTGWPRSAPSPRPSAPARCKRPGGCARRASRWMW